MTPSTGLGRLLVADDDETFRLMTKILLERHGYSCDLAGSGQEAAALLREQDYDLLISDIDMPGNRDLGLIVDLPQLRAGLPVILVTGAPSVESAARSVSLAVAAYLIKPLDNTQFMAAVRRAVEHYHCYRTVVRSRERLLQTSAEFHDIGESLRSQVGGAIDPPVQAFVDITIQNVVSGLTDLRTLLASVHSPERRGVERNDPAESRPMILLQALWETVAVLEKTKHDFKSKELGRLRKKLETLLGESPRTD